MKILDNNFSDKFIANSKACIESGLFTKKQIDDLTKLGYLDYVINSLTSIGFIGVDINSIYNVFREADIVSKDDEFDNIYLLYRSNYLNNGKTLEDFVNESKKYLSNKIDLNDACCVSYSFDGPTFIPIYLKDRTIEKKLTRVDKIDEENIVQYKAITKEQLDAIDKMNFKKEFIESVNSSNVIDISKLFKNKNIVTEDDYDTVYVIINSYRNDWHGKDTINEIIDSYNFKCNNVLISTIYNKDYKKDIAIYLN